MCTGNSCRSQMAEGFGHALKSDKYDFYSAGIEKHGQNPKAIKVMAEVAVDISKQHSQLIEDLPTQEFDYVVTVCGHANEYCPYFPAKTKVIHIGFEDPPTLAKNLQNEQDILNCYREVRDKIKNVISNLENYLE